MQRSDAFSSLVLISTDNKHCNIKYATSHSLSLSTLYLCFFFSFGILELARVRRVRVTKLDKPIIGCTNASLVANVIVDTVKIGNTYTVI